MARIEIANERVDERIRAVRAMCEEKRVAKDRTIDAMLERLSKWNCEKIIIGRDYDELSFTFQCIETDGSLGINGGIIFHGARDGYGSGNGPTYSVTLNPTDGYEIHT